MRLLLIGYSLFNVYVGCQDQNDHNQFFTSIKAAQIFYTIPPEIRLIIYKYALDLNIDIFFMRKVTGDIASLLDVVYRDYLFYASRTEQIYCLKALDNYIRLRFHREMPIPYEFLKVVNTHYAQPIKSDSLFIRPTIYNWYNNWDNTLRTVSNNILLVMYCLMIDGLGARSLQGISALNGIQWVKHISITSGNLERIAFRLQMLPCLENLLIIKNKLKKIRFYEISGSPQLQSVSLYNNNITHVDIDSFVDCPKLETVDLTQNVISPHEKRILKDRYPAITFM